MLGLEKDPRIEEIRANNPLYKEHITDDLKVYNFNQGNFKKEMKVAFQKKILQSYIDKQSGTVMQALNLKEQKPLTQNEIEAFKVPIGMPNALSKISNQRRPTFLSKQDSFDLSKQSSFITEGQPIDQIFTK